MSVHTRGGKFVDEEGERCVNDHCSLCRLPNPDFVHVLWGYSKVGGATECLD